MVPAEVPNGKDVVEGLAVAVAHRQRVARPVLDPEQIGDQAVAPPGAPEIPRSLSPLSPGIQVASGRVEDKQLMGAGVGDDDPSVGELERVVDAVKLEVVASLDGPDRDEGLGTDLPADVGTGGWPGILADEDSGAVSCQACRSGLGVRHGFGVRRGFAAGDRQSQQSVDVKSGGARTGHSWLLGIGGLARRTAIEACPSRCRGTLRPGESTKTIVIIRQPRRKDGLPTAHPPIGASGRAGAWR